MEKHPKNSSGQFIKKEKTVYVGREKEYKREWWLRNRKRLLERKRKRYQENKVVHNAAVKLWQMANKEKVRQYKAKNKDKKRFDGNNKAALERDNHQCRVCQSKDKLLVHHLDESENRKKMNANNNLENLITLCRSCHLKVHKYKMKI